MFENIYDFGANRGQNLKYFLNYTENVIAVEPIPELFEEISNGFKEEIISKKLNEIIHDFTYKILKSKYRKMRFRGLPKTKNSIFLK